MITAWDKLQASELPTVVNTDISLDIIAGTDRALG